MNEYYKVIADIEELKYFYDNVLVKPENGESIMICHSARAKKLNDEERKLLGTNRAEMFHTEISKKRVGEDYIFEDFLALVSKLEVNKNAYLTKAHAWYPDKSLVSYIYMNPCSEAACAQDTLNEINVINAELINAGLRHSEKGIADSIWKLSTISNHIKSCHAQNPSRKVWIDFDIDCLDLDEEGIKKIKDATLKFFKEGQFVMVRTSGGVHCLVKREFLKFNPAMYCNEITNALSGYEVPEVKKNDNCMIPVPGTLQYGFTVKVIR
jgi:hypothetical protein